MIFTFAGFVVIVSVVRVVVLSRIGKTDVTWNYINGGIWAETEPSVAVICACLPSLRPLFSLLYTGITNIPDVKSKLSNVSSSSHNPIWRMRSGLSRGSKGSEDDGSEGGEELGGRGSLGHEVSVHGGEGGKEGVPEEGIRVKTEVVLVSSQRLDYEDRLF